MKKNEQTTKQIYGISSKPIVIIGVIIAFALAFAGLFWMLSSAVSSSIIEANVGSMQELAQHDLNSIRNSIVLRWENMEGVAKELENTSYEGPNELLSMLKAKARDIPSASKLSLLNSKGTNFLSNGVVEKNSYLADACAGKTERFVIRMNTSVHFSENIHEVLFEMVPVDFNVGEDHFEWLICQFPIDTLENELRITSYNGEGYSSIIDMDGNYIINMSGTHNFTSFDNFFNDMKDAKVEGRSSMAELFASQEHDTAIFTLNGAKNIMVMEKMKIADWYFLTTVPMSVFDTQTNAITHIFITMFGVLALIVAVVLILLLRQRKQTMDLQIAEATNRSKTEFLFNMSHDIRTPMNAILGNTDIAIKHHDDRKRVDECLSKIRIAGEHLLDLINDILEMSRIESGKLEISEEPMDVRRLVESVEVMSNSLAIPKSIDFRTDAENIPYPYVYSDMVHANEVMINLLSNAIKYTPDGGKVRLIVDQPYPVKDGRVIVRCVVSDNGIGMSDEFQQHLFEAFSREKSSTVSRQEGAGLGLSIVKKIVDLAGGTISVKSRKNEGSTFTVQLPLRVMEEEAIAKFVEENKPQRAVEKKFSFDGKKVLLVEDNEMNREIATEILEEVGLIIDTAEDGQFAVQAVSEKGIAYYDFILMDIQMPVMDGYEATKAIRAMPGGDKATIIALSANAFKEDIDKSLSLGMNAHVAKPVDVKVLFETMKGLTK